MYPLFSCLFHCICFCAVLLGFICSFPQLDSYYSNHAVFDSGIFVDLSSSLVTSLFRNSISPGCCYCFFPQFIIHQCISLLIIVFVFRNSETQQSNFSLKSLNARIILILFSRLGSDFISFPRNFRRKITFSLLFQLSQVSQIFTFNSSSICVYSFIR